MQRTTCEKEVHTLVDPLSRHRTLAKSGLTVTRPVAVWNKPLRADFKTLFKALSKLTAHGLTGEWTNAALDAADGLHAIGFDYDPGQLAWLLIRRVLTHAIFELVAEKVPLLHPGEHHTDSLIEELDLSLDQMELAIDASFLERPGELAIVEALRVPFEQWLRRTGLEAAQAKATGGRLRRPRPGYRAR